MLFKVFAVAHQEPPHIIQYIGTENEGAFEATDAGSAALNVVQSKKIIKEQIFPYKDRMQRLKGAQEIRVDSVTLHVKTLLPAHI